MKFLIKFSVLSLAVAILFAACQKTNIDEIVPENPVYEADTIRVNPIILQMRSLSPDSINIDCISIPFPVDLLQASGNTITVNSSAELDAALMLPDSIVDFVYPFDAVANNQVFQIQKVEDLAIALVACASTPVECGDLQPHVLLFFNGLNILTLNKYAYDINYPVTLIVEGNQVVLNSDDDYLPAIGGSPFSFPETELVYPITITQFGQDIVLNSDSDVCEFYATLDEDCQNKPAHIQFFFNEGPGSPINCTYFVDYPVNITLNGNTIQIPSRDAYLDLLDSSPNGYNGIALVYPVTAQDLFGTQLLTFNSDDDICEYLNNCQ